MSLQFVDLRLNLTALMPCLMECDSLVEMGPPPDLIAGMPPPPIPAFLRDPVELLAASNGSCNLCGWAGSDDVQLMEIPRKFPMIDDMWYFVIISAAVGAILFGVLVVIASLRCKEAKVKPAHDPCSKVEKKVVVNPVQSPPHPMALPPGVSLGGPGPKALWSGLKGSESSAYSLHHHPIGPELLSNYERVDYGSVGHTRPLSPAFRMPAPIPPPLPLHPPPPTCPTYCAGAAAGNQAVHIMGNGNAYYANPESLDGSFENGGYVDSECGGGGSVVEVLRVAPDGAVVGRRCRPFATPVHGGFAGSRPAFPPHFGFASCHEQAQALESRRDGFKTGGFALPPIAALNHHNARVSSPLV